MLMGRKYFNNDIIYTIFKKHNCPKCGTLLNCVKVSKIVHSKSPEAKDFNFSFSGGDGYMIGNVKFIWKEFECSNCKQHYTVNELKSIERENIIFDHQIRAVTRSNADGQDSSIVYADTNGKIHSISLESNVQNYKNENPICSNRCVGARKIDDKYFILYTSGVKTKIIFKKLYVLRYNKNNLFTGKRNSRFQEFQRLLGEANYTTFDLS